MTRIFGHFWAIFAFENLSKRPRGRPIGASIGAIGPNSVFFLPLVLVKAHTKASNHGHELLEVSLKRKKSAQKQRFLSFEISRNDREGVQLGYQFEIVTKFFPICRKMLVTFFQKGRNQKSDNFAPLARIETNRKSLLARRFVDPFKSYSHYKIWATRF